MTILKCKTCGGDIQVDGQTHGVCEYCGNEVTFPRLDDDKRAEMYNRANERRQRNEFDEAYAAYEHIIAEDNTDAEAHWNLMLCRYGITYVYEKRRDEYMPTCNRLIPTPVEKDIDYLAAIEYADPYNADIYRREAARIAQIQKRYFEIASTEQPYDVFICYKMENASGGRTDASVVGERIHSLLEAEGVRTFFAKITLESKLGTDYEPYIYAALNSAKVMILVADNPSQYDEIWVKNEWKRYLAIMDKDRTKDLIPVCVGMDPSQIPSEIPKYQAVDWSRVGAEQDLIRGVQKKTGKLKTVTQVVANAAPSVTSTSVLEAAERALASDDFNYCLKLIDDVLEKEPENCRAHLCAFLAHNKASRLEELPCFETIAGVEVEKNWEDDVRFKRIRRYADAKMSKKLDDFIENQQYECIYVQAERVLSEEEFEKAARLYESIPHYKESKKLSEVAWKKKREVDDFEDSVKRLKGEIGNRDEYLIRTFANRYTNEYNHAERLRYIAYKNSIARDFGWNKWPIILPILTVILGLMAILAGGIESPGIILWSIAVVVYYDEYIFRWFNGIIVKALICFGVTALIAGVSSFDSPLLSAFVIIALSTPGVLILVRDIVTRSAAGKADRDREVFYRERMIPIANEIIDDLIERYGERATSALEIQKLRKSFKDRYNWEDDI